MATCIVYALRAKNTPLVKIGITGNLQQRVTALQRACPFALVAEEAVYTHSAVESYLHNLHKTHRTWGEWFELEKTADGLLIDLPYPSTKVCVSKANKTLESIRQRTPVSKGDFSAYPKRSKGWIYANGGRSGVLKFDKAYVIKGLSPVPLHPLKLNAIRSDSSAGATTSYA